MEITINGVSDLGDDKKERLALKVTADTDIGKFAVFRVYASKGVVTSLVLGSFWFPDQAVKSGDLVVLYSRSGTPSSKILDNGKTAYFYYWGQQGSFWDNSDEAAVVVRIDDWISKTPPKK